jgi:hypothetical protein
MNKPPIALTRKWADILNDWYDMSATGEEARDAFTALNLDAEYISTYLKKANGVWRQDLDTADRERLSDAIRQRRIEKILSWELPEFTPMTDKTVQLSFRVPSMLDTPSEVLLDMKSMLLDALAQYQPKTPQQVAIKACLLAM